MTGAMGLSGSKLLLTPGLIVILVIMSLLHLVSGGESRAMTRVSSDAQGSEGNGESQAAAITSDGRRVAFASEADNLVSGDSNGVEDIFVKDMETAVVVRYSTDSSGAQGNGGSFDPTVSLDGGRTAFSSAATNLVSDDSNGADDIFVKDTVTGATTRVSTDSSGAQADGASELAMISADGRYVIFTSSADNLVPGDSNGVKDVFVKDTATGATTRASTDSSGAQADGQSGYIYGPDISADGRYAVFSSQAADLVSEDSNGVEDVFLKDTATGVTTRVSMDSAGGQADGDSFFPAISDDGLYVSFRSVATNLDAEDTDTLSDIYRKDTADGGIMLMSSDSAGVKADRDSWDPSISPDGRYVVFVTDAANLSASDGNGTYDVYMKDSRWGTTMLVSANADGIAGNGWSFGPVVSSNGRHTAFQSLASDLTPGITNGVYDIFRLSSASDCGLCLLQ